MVYDFSHNRRMALTWTWLALVTAIVAAVLVAIAGPLYRHEAISLTDAFYFVQYGAWTGIAAALAGIIGILACIFTRRWRMLGVATLALALGVVSFLWPYSIDRAVHSTPPIHDISTDTAQPPQFIALARARQQSPNGLEWGGNPAGTLATAQLAALQEFFARPASRRSPDRARAIKACQSWGPTCLSAVQKAYYPDIQPLKLPEVDVNKAYAAALATAKSMGWTIAAANATTHHIEATATSFWFGLKYDIALDIRTQGRGSVVNMRSESRLLLFDLGDNAQRTRDYLNALRERLQE